MAVSIDIKDEELRYSHFHLRLKEVEVYFTLDFKSPSHLNNKHYFFNSAKLSFNSL